MSERLWCAYCGQWGDHQSGWCHELLRDETIILKEKIHDLEQEILFLRAERDAAQEEREILAQDCHELQKKPKKMKVYLDIVSWRDFGFWGDHYYGELSFDDPNFEDVDLTRIITDRVEAQELDLKVGEKSQRFNSIKDVRIAAKSYIKKNYPKAKLIEI